MRDKEAPEVLTAPGASFLGSGGPIRPIAYEARITCREAAFLGLNLAIPAHGARPALRSTTPFHANPSLKFPGEMDT